MLVLDAAMFIADFDMRTNQLEDTCQLLQALLRLRVAMSAPDSAELLLAAELLLSLLKSSSFESVLGFDDL